MFRTREWITALGLALPAVACQEATSPSLAPEARLTEHSVVRLERIGDPTWRPVDFHLFSAPLGSPPTFEGFFATAVALLPPPNHEFHPGLFIGPGAPHAPPYDTEFAQGVAALGFEEKRVFDASEFSEGNAVYLVFMVVPDPGTTGSSPDFAAGPIIPNTLFPITGAEVTTRNNKFFARTDIFVPALDDPALDPSFDVEGHSHFPFFLADATVFGPEGVGPAGNYKYTTTMTDQQGNGWTIHAHFVVKKKG